MNCNSKEITPKQNGKMRENKGLNYFSLSIGDSSYTYRFQQTNNCNRIPYSMFISYKYVNPRVDFKRQDIS